MLLPVFIFTAHRFQVLNRVLDMPLRFNNQKPVSLFANSGSFNLISENKYMSNQHRYTEQGNHLWTKPKPALQNKQGPNYNHCWTQTTHHYMCVSQNLWEVMTSAKIHWKTSYVWKGWLEFTRLQPSGRKNDYTKPSQRHCRFFTEAWQSTCFST